VLWPAYSTMMALAVVAALWQESRGGPAPWNKLTRTGVVSHDASPLLSGVTE
jgi:poly-beta-1,6-N-acetyl-D-glucosamine synthase